MYKRKLKKHNVKASIVIKEWSEQKEQYISKHYKNYNLQSMNLNIITRHLKCTSKRCFQDNKYKEKFQENCYNCN